MNNLKRLLRRIKKNAAQRPIYAWVALAILVLVVGGVYTSLDIRHRHAQEAVALRNLATQQKAVSAQRQDSVTLPQTKTDVFTDTTSDVFKTNTCDRLKNRPGIIIVSSDCQYNLRAHGKITMAVVFEYDTSYSVGSYDLLKGDANNTASLKYINTYLKNQAKRYKVSDPAQIDLTFFGVYKTTDAVDNLYYHDNSSKLLKTFEQTAQNNAVPEDKYDLTQYVLLDAVYGGVAFPGEHRAFTENSSTVPTFIHETLHLFGATDKYNNNDCNTVGQGDPFGRYNGSISGKDIMCDNFDLSSSTINDITAREIGWTN